MSNYTRKTRDEYEVQGYYGQQYGWECVTGAENRREAQEHRREYRENEPGTAFRIKKMRVPV